MSNGFDLQLSGARLNRGNMRFAIGEAGWVRFVNPRMPGFGALWQSLAGLAGGGARQKSVFEEAEFYKWLGLIWL